MVLKSLHHWILLLSAVVTASLSSEIPLQGFHPFAVLASLLPIQIAALYWCLAIAAKGAESRLEGQKLPAND